MSDQRDHFVEEFNENIELLSQQLGSRFRHAVMEDTHVGEGASVVDQIGEAVSETPTTRNDVKPDNEPPHDRRWVYPTDHDWGATVKKIEQLRKNILPNGKFVKAGLGALRRDMDDEILGQFFADAKTGKSGGTTTSHSNQVAVGVGSSGDTGMNTTKLLQARKLILEADIDIEDPDNMLYCGINPLQEQQLLQSIKVNNKDYNEPIFNTQGVLKNWFGINFLITNRLNTDANSDFRVPFWAKSGMHLGIWQDLTSNIVERYDLKRDPWHVSTSATFGATRTEEVKVVEIICDPTP